MPHTCTHTDSVFGALVQIAVEDAITKWGKGKGAKSKLSQPVSQRWTSICMMLMRLLQKWDALVQVYAENDKAFPLDGRKKEVRKFMQLSTQRLTLCQFDRG